MVEHPEIAPITRPTLRLRYATMAVIVAIQVGWIAVLAWLLLLVAT